MFANSRADSFIFFFFNDTATTEIYTLSLHDALPISNDVGDFGVGMDIGGVLGLSFVIAAYVFVAFVVVEIGRAHV